MALKILVCEDEKISHGWLVKMIKSWGHTTISAFTGAEAIEHANSEEPDVILLDMLFPDMEGIEVLKEIRSNSDLDQTEVITASATEAEELAPKLKDLRVRASLNKPIKKADLKKLLVELEGNTEGEESELPSFMVVTKNSVHQKVIEKLLIELNCRIIAVESLDEAEHLLASVKITGMIIEMDIEPKQVKDMLTRLTSVVLQQTPIIVETATADQSVVEEFFRFGITDILVKPIHMSRIKESVQKVLGRLQAVKEERSDQEQKTVLIVEDFSITANMLSKLFARTNLKTFVARSGPEAFEMIVKKKPRLMLLDLNLPGMNGFDLLKLMESKGISIPFAVSTAERDESKLRLLKKMGALKIFRKPLNSEELLSFMKWFDFEKGILDQKQCDYQVLLAATDDSTIGVAELAIRRADLDFLLVSDSERALAEIKNHPPLMLLDIGLKGKNIREFVIQVRSSKQNAALKIVGLANKLNTSMRDEMTALGVDAYFEKPINTSKLTSSIQEMLSTLAPSVDISEFTSEFLKELDSLSSVQDEAYYEQSKRLGHNLAGTAGLISSKELHEVGMQLEDAAARKNGAECIKHLQQIRQLIEQMAAKATLMK